MQQIRARMREVTATCASRVRNLQSFNIGGGNCDIDFVIRGPELETLAEYAEALRAAGAELGIIDADTTLKLNKPELRVADRSRPRRRPRRRTQDIGRGAAPDGRRRPGSHALPRSAVSEDYDVQLRLVGEGPPRSRHDRAALRAAQQRRAGAARLRRHARGGPEPVARRSHRPPAPGQRCAPASRRAMRWPIASRRCATRRPSSACRPAYSHRRQPAAAASWNGRSSSSAGRSCSRSSSCTWCWRRSTRACCNPLIILLSLPLSLPFALLSLCADRQHAEPLLGARHAGAVRRRREERHPADRSHAEPARAQGMDRGEAILQANRDRLRPILMTTLALVGGMLPLALGTGPGAEERRTIAVVVIGGQTPVAVPDAGRHSGGLFAVRRRGGAAGGGGAPAGGGGGGRGAERCPEFLILRGPHTGPCVGFGAPRARPSTSMTDAAPASLKKTALHAAHVALGARMVPVRRLGHAGRVLRHHRRAPGGARRAPASSMSRHMGEIEFAGADALDGRAAHRPATTSRSWDRPGAVLRPARRPTARSSTTCSSTASAPTHFLLVVNAGEHRQGLRLDQREHRRSRRRDVGGELAATRYALHRAAGPRGARHPAAADRRRPRRPRSTTGSRTARSPACAATVSRTGYTGEDGFEIFVAAGDGRRASGRRSSTPASRSDDPRRPRRARHAAPRGGDAPYGNDIDETTTRARGRPRLDRRLEEGRRSSARDVLHAQKANGVAAEAGRLRDGRPRHRAPRLSGRRRRRAGRRRHQRHADAVPEESDRHGLRAARAVGARAPSSRSTSAAGASRRVVVADAVLQAREVKLTPT